MARWVGTAARSVVIDGCFLKCHGRVLKSLIGEEKLVHIDALPLHRRYKDVFSMDDVPEDERKAVARQVADAIVAQLRDRMAVSVEPWHRGGRGHCCDVLAVRREHSQNPGRRGAYCNCALGRSAVIALCPECCMSKILIDLATLRDITRKLAAPVTIPDRRQDIARTYLATSPPRVSNKFNTLAG